MMVKNNPPISTIIRSQYLGEPNLEFADGRNNIDPKLGISRFGPKSFSPKKRHPSHVKVGFIGSAETIDSTRKWILNCAKGISGDEKHPEFPGFMEDRGFFSILEFDDSWNAQLFSSEIEKLLENKKSRSRFESILILLEQKLDILTKRDQPPDYIVIGLPDTLYNKCRVVNYHDRIFGDVHRDLRRAFKAIAMRYRTPTQFLRQQTVDGREKDFPSKVAWNFFTGLYFKAGGIPWGPTGLLPGTCYVGIGFYRALGSNQSTMHTSLVQAFDEHGDGLVLRGPEFNWNYEEDSRSPHLNQEQASTLINYVLDRYQQEMHQTPQRIVVHKTSKYWPEERVGFKESLRNRVERYDLMSIDTHQSVVRLLIANKYPPLRGTRFTVGDTDYLYTTGFIAELGQFHSIHVPSPIKITDHIGQDTPTETLLREILTLTKMNWNSSRLGGRAPITLKFSDLVGEIMREVPVSIEPMPQYKYYM
ncbi:MAG: hypothetical protein ABSG01_12940 [Anaerolineales bacterium]|jgi:hypothetical protein